jgi:tol-pal system protein YbgF
MQRGEITQAEVLFSEFVRVYPEHDLADNAQYWLGECFYGQKEYEHALNLFKHLVERFPRGNKVPDALYKQALCEKVLGRGDEAAQTARRLQNEYPTTEAAQKAKNLFR